MMDNADKHTRNLWSNDLFKPLCELLGIEEPGARRLIVTLERCAYVVVQVEKFVPEKKFADMGGQPCRK